MHPTTIESGFGEFDDAVVLLSGESDSITSDKVNANVLMKCGKTL